MLTLLVIYHLYSCHAMLLTRATTEQKNYWLNRDLHISIWDWRQLTRKKNSSLLWAEFSFLCLDLLSSLQNYFIFLFNPLNAGIQFPFPGKLFCLLHWWFLCIKHFILNGFLLDCILLDCILLDCFPLSCFLLRESRPQVFKNNKESCYQRTEALCATQGLQGCWW